MNKIDQLNNKLTHNRCLNHKQNFTFVVIILKLKKRMKKIILSALTLFTVVFLTHAQDDDKASTTTTNFGIKAGYSTIAVKLKVDGGGAASDDVSGFYVGGFVEINVAEKFAIQPELVYASYSESGGSSGVLLVPILAKYKPEEKLEIFAGPQFDYFTNEEDAEGLKRLGLGLTLGAGYKVTDNITLDARYSFGLSDRIEDGIDELEGFDVEARFSYFQVGLGYTF